MNGSTNPLLDKEEHVLKLGESFEKRPKSSFHTIRCKCKQTSPTFCHKQNFNTGQSFNTTVIYETKG